MSSHYVDELTVVSVSVPVRGDGLPTLLVVWSVSFGRGWTSEGSSLSRLRVVWDANRLSSIQNTREYVVETVSLVY